MFCEAYNQSLTDAIAKGETLSPVLQQHLDSCQSCCAAFAEEQSLFAAIDSGLRAAANSEVPSTLIPRVHVALNNEPVSCSRRFPVWGFAAAVIAAGVIVAMLYVLPRHPSAPAVSARVSPPSIVAPANPPAPSVVNSPHPRGVSSSQLGRPIVFVANSLPRSESPEVLVPDEERIAFAQFMAHASPLPTNISAKATLAPRAPQVVVEISPVEIGSLEVKPLNPKEGQQGQF